VIRATPEAVPEVIARDQNCKGGILTTLLASKLRGKLRWIARLSVIVILAAISISLIMSQRDPGNRILTDTPEAGPAELGTVGDLPGLPDQNRPMNDPAEWDPTAGVDPKFTTAEDVAMKDSAQLEVREPDPPKPRGGPDVVASVQDGAELVVRNADGTISQQETVR
jgi:hypothetical protein